MSEKKILINYKGANIESVSAGPRDLIRLTPGINSVDADVWARVIAAAKVEAKDKKSKTKGGILFLIENDLVVEVPAMGAGGDDAETDENGLVDITKMKPREGIEVVNAELDLGTLGVFLAAEKGGKNRATLVAAIEKQIDALTKADEEDANKED